ncbi:hypothetical protein [Ammoniphilus sp. 3BR4]|uniref:hypothetical protein n=1 Tax=Ammoniphilus sp. 3BR4 TaxID=3158265 RepID=UPI003466F40F
MARTELQAAPGALTFAFPGNLGMEEYIVIHQALKNIVKAANASVDDSNSLLGYLPSGEGAHILTRFEAWISFLLEAKHKSMKGQKVRVIEESGRVIGEGLLMELETEEDSFFSVKKCTLVTTFGEQSFSGKNLKIEPTGEW